MKKVKMKSQKAEKEAYIGDEHFVKMLEHYRCPTPLNVIKMRFLGAICSPNLSLRPSDVISSFWPEGEAPRLQTKQEAELFFKFFMGLWDNIFNDIKLNHFRFEAIKAETAADLSLKLQQRYEAVEYGYVEGFWGGKENLKLPAYIAEIIDSIGDLGEVYLKLQKKSETVEDISVVLEAVHHTDRMVEKAIEFIIENSVLPRIDELQRSVN